MTTKTRIAPSPTGYLHIGTARTALFNWLFAKKHGGDFILRIEDTDLERSDKKYEEDIIAGLEWLGLNWSNREIYRQSERLDKYRQSLAELLDSGKAFWCDHSKEELEIESREQMADNQAPKHICGHKKKGLKIGQIIRLAVNTDSKEKISFQDTVRGNIEWEEGLLGDFSLAKNLQMPLYNFAAVVDDFDMQISHVIRGEDHISNTPKQILIYKALGKEPPKFAHLPLILGPDRSKLSKRHGATSISEYKKDYLPKALVNFMSFLGYTYSKDIISVEEMVEEFELEKVHKSGAVFDVKKLNWMNSNYVKSLKVDKFKSLVGLKELLDKAVPLITERLEKLSDIKDFDYFWKEPEYDKSLLKWKKATLEESISALKNVHDILEKTEFAKENLQKALDGLGEELRDRGLAYWPLRVTLTGKEKSPDPIDIALILGKEKTIKRIENAIKKLEQ